MSRRTEMAYKAESPGKAARHVRSPGFARYGKCRGCIVTVHVLIRGDLSDVGVVLYDSALCGNMQGDRAGVSRGHSRRRTLPQSGVITGKELGE